MIFVAVFLASIYCVLLWYLPDIRDALKRIAAALEARNGD